VKQKVAIGVVCFFVGFFGSSFLLRIAESFIHGKPAEKITEVKNSDFKIVIRSQEFHHSGIWNVDVCVTNSLSRTFPTRRASCFLHGFDFSDLSARWKTDREIEVSFSSGRVTQFTNSAIVYSYGPVPTEFYTELCDGCTSRPK
jgi:hypothetical protein